MMTLVLLGQAQRAQVSCMERWFRLHVIHPLHQPAPSAHVHACGGFPTTTAVGGKKFEAGIWMGWRDTMVRTKIELQPYHTPTGDKC